MKCEEVESVIIDYLDNSLDEEFRSEIEKHLGTCERCLDELKNSQHILKTISREKMAKPDDSMRINFYHMLHSEIKKSEKYLDNSTQNPSSAWYNHSLYRVAAGFLLLICGTFLGLIIHTGIVNSNNKSELAKLQTEVAELKQSAMFTMLKDESSSDRIQAVNFVTDLENPDEQVIDALVKTLNNDKNVNVRMTAAYALARFANQREVCDSLVKSLSVQDDPIMQITLINILLERKEKSALNPMRQIMSDKSTIKEVKQFAEKGIRMLL
jgi:hypothetical protein